MRCSINMYLACTSLTRHSDQFKRVLVLLTYCTAPACSLPVAAWYRLPPHEMGVSSSERGRWQTM